MNFSGRSWTFLNIFSLLDDELKSFFFRFVSKSFPHTPSPNLTSLLASKIHSIITNYTLKSNSWSFLQNSLHLNRFLTRTTFNTTKQPRYSLQNNNWTDYNNTPVYGISSFSFNKKIEKILIIGDIHVYNHSIIPKNRFRGPEITTQVIPSPIVVTKP